MTNDQPLLNRIERAKALLSPYLDGEVTAVEREQLETALAQSPELQADLKSLQQTVALLGEMPRASAPRPFTLTEADVGLSAAPKKTGFSVWLKPFMGAAAALAALFVVGILVLLNFGSTKEASQIALAPAAPQMAQEAKMESPAPTLEMQRAAPEEAAEAPMEQPAAEAVNSAGIEKAVVEEMEAEGEAALSFAEMASPPEAAQESAAEVVPPAAEKMIEAGAAMKETAPKAEAADIAEIAMEEAPMALDAVSGAVKRAAEMTAASDAAGDAAEEPAPPPAATQIAEAIEADAALLTTPQTATLFVPLVAQEKRSSAETVSPPASAPVSADATPEVPVRQTQTGAMALAIGLAVMGLILVFVVAIFLIVKRK
ncbi:MAG TPA: hypothetical protein G4N96_10830 [Chloroflexi bacterium]|nr:hypothetical protein [Chloroflexota bacterium]